MTTRNLDAVFHPKAIVLVGASEEAHTAGAVSAKNLLDGGFSGNVMLVTPHHAEIFGTPCHPGFIWTPMVEGFLKSAGQGPRGRAGLDDLHPLGHVGEPDDIAWGAVYLASEEAKFVTGAELVIDGGYTAR